MASKQTLQSDLSLSILFSSSSTPLSISISSSSSEDSDSVSTGIRLCFYQTIAFTFNLVTKSYVKSDMFHRSPRHIHFATRGIGGLFYIVHWAIKVVFDREKNVLVNIYMSHIIVNLVFQYLILF